MLEQSSPTGSAIPQETIQHLLHEQNLKKQRLARKAELARLSRRRKKARLSELEQENKLLRDEIEHLKRLRAQDQQRIAALLNAASTATQVPQNNTLPDANDGPHRSKSELSLPMEVVDRMVCFDKCALPACNSPKSSDSSSTHPLSPMSAPHTPEIPALEPASVALPTDNTVVFQPVVAESPVMVKQQVQSQPWGGMQSPSDVPKNLKQIIEDLLHALKQHLATASAKMNAAQLSSSTPLQASFLKWIFNQKDSFYEAHDGLWTSLFAGDLGCTPAQLQALKNTRDSVKSGALGTAQLQEILNKLKLVIQTQSSANQVTMEQLNPILTPQQLEALFGWIQRFGAICIKINI
jgi:hypothetical protein